MGFSENEIFAGTYEGVYYSNDEGLNWNSTNTNLENTTASSILVLKDKTVLAATGEGVFRSTDKGKSWNISSKGLLAFDASYVKSINQKIFCSLGRRVNTLVSENAGLSWNFITDKLPWGLSIYSITKFENTYMIGGNEGIYTFNPENLQWKSIINNLGRQIIFFIVIKEKGIFVGTTNGIFVSFDGGATWTERNNGLVDNYILSMSSDENNLYVGTESGFYKSSDLGLSWIKSSNLPLYARQIKTLGNRIIAGTDAGIYTSDNEGASWQKHNNGISNNNITDIQNLDSLVFVGTLNGIFMSTDRGLSWRDISDGLDHKVVNSITFNKDTIIIGTNGSIWQRPLNQLITRNKDISTSIGSLKIHSQIILKEIHITIPEDLKIIKYSIYNLNGKEVRQINSEMNLPAITIDVSNLAPGKYIIQAMRNDFQILQNTFIKL